MMPEQLRRDVGVLTDWIRSVGKALAVILLVQVAVLAGVGAALVGVRAALDNQNASRARDACSIGIISDANADLFVALVELDRDGNISDASSDALADQAAKLNDINALCERG